VGFQPLLSTLPTPSLNPSPEWGETFMGNLGCYSPCYTVRWKYIDKWNNYRAHNFQAQDLSEAEIIQTQNSEVKEAKERLGIT